MARGENEKTGLGKVGWGIGVGFTAICAIALYCVLTAKFRVFGGPVGGPVSYRSEPFTGAYTTFAQITHHACLVSTATTASAAADDVFAKRGYAAGSAWTPRALPFDGAPPDLEGGCGVVVFVGSGITGHLLGATAGPNCYPGSAVVSACDGDRIEVQGSGTAEVRTFVFPALTPEVVRATGLPIDAYLAHAEAELLLRPLGWTPSDQIVRSTTTATGFSSVPVPFDPASGCVAWIAYAAPVESCVGRWQSMEMSRAASEGAAIAGTASCRISGALETGAIEGIFGSSSSSVYYRPYTPTMLSVAPAGAPTPTLTTSAIRIVDAEDLTAPSPLAVPIQ